MEWDTVQHTQSVPDTGSEEPVNKDQAENRGGYSPARSRAHPACALGWVPVLGGREWLHDAKQNHVQLQIWELFISRTFYLIFLDVD